MAVLSERLLLIIDAKTGGAVKDFQGLSTEAKRAQGQVGGLQGGFQRLGLSADAAATASTAMASAALVALPVVAAGMAKAVKSASDLNESLNRSQITFGGSTKAVVAFAEGADRSLGLSERAALDATSSFGALFQALHVGQKESADMSVSLTRLAADMGSAFNTSTADAAAALRSGLSGEAEPLKQYNVIANDTMVTQRALALGLAKTSSEVSEQDKLFARLTLIYEQTNKAQGDFARTSASLANQQRILGATTENLSANLGTLALPTATSALGGLNLAMGGLDSVTRKTGTSLGTIAKGVATGLAGVAGLLIPVNDIFGKSDDGQFKNTNDALKVYAEEVSAGRTGSEAFGKALDYIRGEASKSEAVTKQLNVDLGGTAIAAGKAEEAVTTLYGALQSYTGAQRAREDAERRVTDLGRQMVDLEDQRAKLVAKGAVDVEKVADAERDLAKAREGLGDANKTLSGAEADLVTAERDLVTQRATAARDAVEKLQRAELDYRSSVLDTADAQDRLYDAQVRLDKLRAGPSTTDLAEAQLRVDEAKQSFADAAGRAFRGEGDSAQNALDVARARVEQARAEENLATVRDGGTDKAREIKDAERDIERARIGLKTSTLDQTTADRDLTTAREPTTVSAQGVADAEERVDAARRGVRTAAEEVQTAERHLREARVPDPDFNKRLADLDEQIATNRFEQSRATADVRDRTYEARVQAEKYATALYNAGDAAVYLGRKLGALPTVGMTQFAETNTVAESDTAHRALGGPANGFTVVGEHGPELLRLGSTAAYVTPIRSSSVPSSSTATGDTTHVHINLDGREVADVVTRHQRSMDRQGGDWRGRR